MTYYHRGLISALELALAEKPGATLHEVARRIGVHPHTLARIVRAETGLAFRDWLLQRRIQRAKQLLLAEPSSTIGGVASRVGFSTVQAFGRAFRRACGQRPSDWRRDAEVLSVTLSGAYAYDGWLAATPDLLMATSRCVF